MTLREFRRELKDWSGGLAYWASTLKPGVAKACLTKELLLKYFHKVETVSYSWEAKKETANASK